MRKSPSCEGFAPEQGTARGALQSKKTLKNVNKQNNSDEVGGSGV